MLKSKFAILLFLIIVPLILNAKGYEAVDTTLINTSFKVNGFIGTLVPHEKPLNPLKKGLIKAFEISYGVTDFNTEPWRNYYNNPEVGVAYLFMDLGYPKVLGMAHCIYPYISFPLENYNKTVSFRLKTSLGLAYTTKVFDSISNPLNVAISSPINLYASLGFEIGFKISNRFEVCVGFTGSHLSNGAIKKPNYGLNILTGNFGVNYNLSRKTIIQYKSNNYDNSDSRWLLIVGGGIKEANKPGGPKYGIATFSIEYSKSFKTYFRYGTSLDYMYDGSTIKHFNDDLVKYNSSMEASKVGATIMGEMTLNRLSAFANLGIYIHNHDKQNQLLYQRIGLRYRMSNSIYSQIALKSHMNVADYIEFGVIISI